MKTSHGCDDCFCNVTAKSAGAYNKPPRVVVILEGKKGNKLFYWRIPLLVMWNIEVYQIPHFFVGLLLLVATVSFPYVLYVFLEC